MPLLILISIFTLFSCTHTSDTKKTARIYFETAEKYKKNKNYSKALENLIKIRKSFFDSSYNQKALLMTADIYFDQKKYPQALAGYKKYQKIYGSADQPYILYQMTLCYKNQLPSRAEYDLSIADFALVKVEQLLRLNSTYQKKALKIKQELIDKKAEKELKTILFFTKLGWQKAGFKRAKELLAFYPKSSLKPKILLTAIQLAEKLKEDSTPFKKELLEKHPQSASAQNLGKKSFLQQIKDKIL